MSDGASVERVDKRTLDVLVARFEQPSFIATDPISIPHGFEDPRDQEIIGLFSALLAWGRRATTLAKMAELCERMSYQPFRYIQSLNAGTESALDGFKHRTFNSADAIWLSRALSKALARFGTIEALFATGFSAGDHDIGSAIEYAMSYLLSYDGMPVRMRKHLPRPSTGSACKRLCLYARWMTRSGPVDLGLWNAVHSRNLVLPLDIHSGSQARSMGMLCRKQSDWKAAMELTAACRSLDADDPCRYDYAFFGAGIAASARMSRA